MSSKIFYRLPTVIKTAALSTCNTLAEEGESGAAPSRPGKTGTIRDRFAPFTALNSCKANRRCSNDPSMPQDHIQGSVSGSTAPLSTGSNATPPSAVGALTIVLLYKKGALSDERFIELLDQKLTSAGVKVFIDRHLSMGVEWAKEIEGRIRAADAIVPLISAASVQSEMLSFELEHAHEASQQSGRPRIFPIRLQYEGPLPEPLDGILAASPAIHWAGEQDDDRVASELGAALKAISVPKAPIRISVTKGLRLMPRSSPAPRAVVAPPAPSTPPPLEPIGGAVPLNSGFYLVRQPDHELRTALARYDSIILTKGARQMGKTSLLARGLQFARERGARVALTDFQKFNAANLESVASFYLSLAESLADQLDLPVLPSDVWDDRRGPNVNFERYIRREVLGKINAPLVWGLDEVDRLFVCSFGSEVFGLFRSWHNERALDPSGPWGGLTLVIAYATEAHLFITDMNQSPFNIGTRLVLEDFSPEQVSELNRRYGGPLNGPEDIKRFISLVGGHPFLVRRGLHEMTAQRMDIESFETEACKDEGVFGDHLRRILVLLAKDQALTEVVRGILRGHSCPTPESFYRLRSGGVMIGNSQTEIRPRCQLYERYLKRHLL